VGLRHTATVLLTEGEPDELLMQLLDQVLALGETARQIKEALGHNGDRPEKAKELIECLRDQL